MSNPAIQPEYVIRGAAREDLQAVVELAQFLDSVNLPADDPGVIEEGLALSERSFSGAEPDPRRRHYVFVAEHTESGRLVATSSVTGQVGRRDAPHIFFDVRTEERYSGTLDRHFRHLKLQIGFSYDGPTSLGGLVVHPDHRRTPHRVGTQISLVRFLFIAMHRRWFRDRLVAELLPPLEPDGTSKLWEAVGRHFTDLTYREADRLSKKNKEFVRGLFPDGDIYASLLPEGAQAVIGEVGAQTRGVARLLERVGFRYANRVDPFDGGPYFEARTDEVATLGAARPLPPGGLPAEGAARLVGCDLAGPPWFRSAVATPDRVPQVLGAVAEAGRPVWLAPL
ncbi:MAG: arginine N-succinyltransferase [Myxococcota bacterium]